ncbi:MAG: hypothetical protein C5B48_01415 [Candidatus Rokuibacteriota bacterium]|nr:MAG: hypothetical protein C5B48_01415 [Candidatus Rokubacteria bacterium]
MRRLAWCAAIPIVLVLVSDATVTGELATQSRRLPGLSSAKVRDGPAGPHRRVQALRPAPETLAALRARWPVRGPIHSGFGPRGSFWGRHFHTGVDIGARRGTPVHTPAPGTVAFAGWRGGYGRTVIIDHGRRVQSLYGHLSKLDVKRGQTVAAGTQIGRTGSTGHSSGPHLHYEVLVNRRPVDPRDHPPGAPRRSGQSTR